MTYSFDPLVPRPIDMPTAVPLGDDVDLAALDEAKIFAAPDDPADWPAWRRRLQAWREDARDRHAYDGAAYERPNARWAASCFTVAQVWLWDELLYSFEEHRFTPERFVADARERFGGLDAVVLWHAYPVIGIDDRNQWDFYRDVPGLTGLVEDLHAAGLHVFVDYNPWDTGTRRGEDDVTELAAVVRELQADGVFLDTLKKADPELVESLERARPGIVLEGESKLAVERIVDHNTSWAQFFADSEVPGVLRAHWYERRHMQHHIRRWHRDHSDELQSAWLNGVGVMVWEVVFGVWVGWNPRDAATLTRMVVVQRAAGDLLLEGEWTPLVEISADAHAAGVYASTFSRDGVTLWTLVSRGASDWSGVVPLAGHGGGAVLDLFTDADTGAVAVPARSVGAALQLAPGASEPHWLPELRARLADLEHDDDARFPHRLARRLGPAPAPSVPAEGVPADAVVVPAGEYVLTVRHRARETGMYQGAPYVDEWKPLVPRLHDARTLQRDGVLERPVAVAATEATNAEFAEFLDATGYAPAHPHRFLAHWAGGRPPAGHEDEPVTFVDLDDARAYCAWRGGRLPTEDEWQLAGEQGLRRGEPAVWNWTESEHSDGRTRFAMLKGGSAHQCEGSEWYFDGGVRGPEFTAKLLVPGLGLARSSSIGFRCAWTLGGER
ncbi:SUMF1/EgtB/PvdO family nonheme iron enzyme [Georgenia subflava]|uniref:SUMF1/EgtB/PvdO family nonheme iron enzyme n=1 Tax=Georgenia subflava TaxID=1622177 RepID=A0A6N7EFZ3_9MICO|nr:SUMF1/EgtB/PvdO family nonheme iron enzyme [Georgenia subflava]MPV35595.1 SUMF1/EgtB/PvdO family nonheme iron enzyme [Georgenia subflava]